MIKQFTALCLLGGFAALLPSVALGQVMRPFDNPGLAAKSAYAATESRPTVSPYLNLGTSTNGLSNYQTLVRPLIEEREVLNRQWAELERLNSRVTGAPLPRQPNRLGNGGRAGTAVRYMHYSHYFGGNR